MSVKKPLTKAQAVKKAREHLFAIIRKLPLEADDDSLTSPSIYRREAKPDPCWCVRVPVPIPGLGTPDQMGASFFILVSKKTGKIIFSGRAGE